MGLPTLFYMKEKKEVKKMKKFFIVGMFCFMLAAFAACGEANSTSEETTQSSAGAENEQKGEDAGSDIER